MSSRKTKLLVALYTKVQRTNIEINTEQAQPLKFSRILLLNIEYLKLSRILLNTQFLSICREFVP